MEGTKERGVKENYKKNNNRKSLRWLRLIGKLLMIIGIVLLTIFLVFQIPAVQTQALKFITKSLSNQLQTKVEIDYFRLGFFGKLNLEGVYVEDLQGDTLLYSKGVVAAIDLSPITLLQSGLIIDKIKLDDSKLIIRRKADELETNLNLLLAPLKKEKPKEKKSGLALNLKLDRIDLGKMIMLKKDRLKNQNQEISVSGGFINVCSVDLANSEFNLGAVRLDQPIVKIDDYIRTPLWDSFLNTQQGSGPTDLKIAVENLKINDAIFSFHNYRKAPVKITPDSILDYKHMEVFDVKWEIEDFLFERDTFVGGVKCFSLRDSSGFELVDWTAENARVDPNGVMLTGMRFLTPNSEIGDTLQLRYARYSDFVEFPDRVIMDIKFKDSKVAFRDIIKFAPKLNDTRFFDFNREKIFSLDGRFKGTVNNLDGLDLLISDNRNSEIALNFSSRDLAVPGRNLLNLNIADLKTNVHTLRALLPNFDLPSNFNKLGPLRYKGDVNIFFSDVITDGQLQTAIGAADLDIQLRNLSAGKTRTRYSGKMNLMDFDLGEWTGNIDYGKVSLDATVVNGVGMTGASANADFSAKIKSFVFKDYNYHNATIVGAMRSNEFDGRFDIKDENVDFSFNGEIDLRNEHPTFDFDAAINHLDLYSLNLAKEDLRLKGNLSLNLRNKSLSDLVGQVNIKKLQLSKNNKAINIDYIDLASFLNPDSTKLFQINSDVIDGHVSGDFDLEKIPKVINWHFQDNFPEFSKQLKLKPVDSLLNPQTFEYNFKIKESKGIQYLFVDKLEDIKNATFKGVFSKVDSTFKAEFHFPDLKLGKSIVKGLDVYFDTEKSEGDFNFEAGGVAANSKDALVPLIFQSTFAEDSLFFGLTYDNPSEKAALNKVHFDGHIGIIDSISMLMEMDTASLIILDAPWSINRNNKILFKKDSVIIKDFTARYEDESIDRIASLESFGKKGIELSVVNLNLKGLNRQLKYEPLQFAGDFNVVARTSDFTKLKNIFLELDADSLMINDDFWGNLHLVGQLDSTKAPLHTVLSLKKDTTDLLLNAVYNLAEMGIHPKDRMGYFDADLNITNFPLLFAEYFIGGTISDSKGSFGAKLHFYGQTDMPKTSGTIDLSPGAVTLNYLKTRYSFQEEQFLVDNYAFETESATLYDTYGNSAEIIGGIRHNHLKDFGFSALLTTDKFQGLNTKKGDNSLFYGQGIGKAEIQFTNTFKQPDIYVNATVAEGTKISIPISSAPSTSDFGFVNFTDRDAIPEDENEDTKKREDESYDLKGVSLEMNLEANNSAIMQIIFDEQAGDVIEGRGSGSLSVSVPRDGDFKMYGNYTIESGDYLFTLYNFFNKKFRIQKGGTIAWNGDPFAAEVDLVAEYNRVSTSVYNFIQDILVTSTNPDLIDQASERTDVDLILYLTGQLLQPDINFDISFPSLDGELKNYVDSKLRILKLDQNEMNKQAFGLIVASQFIPSDINLQGQDLFFNSVGEFVSNQLSLILSEFLSDVIGGGNFLSSLDFDIAYSQYQNIDYQSGQNINRGNELQVSLRSNLLNDRVSVRVGGNVGLNNNLDPTATNPNAFLGDVLLEYFVNEDRTVVLKVYSKQEPDIGGRKVETGAGLSFRREFNTFGELLRSLRKKPKDQSKGQK